MIWRFTAQEHDRQAEFPQHIPCPPASCSKRTATQGFYWNYWQQSRRNTSHTNVQYTSETTQSHRQEVTYHSNTEYIRNTDNDSKTSLHASFGNTREKYYKAGISGLVETQCVQFQLYVSLWTTPAVELITNMQLSKQAQRRHWPPFRLVKLPHPSAKVGALVIVMSICWSVRLSVAWNTAAV